MQQSRRIWQVLHAVKLDLSWPLQLCGVHQGLWFRWVPWRALQSRVLPGWQDCCRQWIGMLQLMMHKMRVRMVHGMSHPRQHSARIAWVCTWLMDWRPKWCMQLLRWTPGLALYAWPEAQFLGSVTAVMAHQDSQSWGYLVPAVGLDAGHIEGPAAVAAF